MDRCPICAAEVRPGDVYCLICGQRLLPDTPSPLPVVEKKKNNSFTDEAVKCMIYAQEEAKTFQHRAIRVEHLLLGIIREEEERKGSITKLLDNIKMENLKLRAAITFIFGQGLYTVGKGDLDHTPQAKKVFLLAAEQAEKLAHPSIDTIHILKALVSDNDSTILSIFDIMDIDRADLLEKIENLFQQLSSSETTN